MNEINDLLHVITQYYAGSTACVEPAARRLTLSEGSPSSTVLAAAAHADAQARLVNLDVMTDELACAETERCGPDGYHREALGLLRAEGRWRVVCAMQADTPYRFANPCGSSDFQCAENAAIERVLLRYCHDVYRMDADDCLPLFWDDARMYHPNGDGSFTDVPITVLRQRWENAPDARALGLPEFSRICRFELFSADVASAKIGCAKLDSYFNDYLWLMKSNGTWKIVNKLTQCLYIGALQ